MKRKGFTLVELICVLGICGILFSIVSINSKSIIRQIDDYKFNNACLNLISDIRYAKICALTHGYVKVIFNKNGYDINYCTFSNSLIKQVRFNKKIELDINVEHRKIIFTSKGNVLPRVCSIIMTDKNGNSKTITIKPATYTVDFKRKEEYE